MDNFWVGFEKRAMSDANRDRLSMFANALLYGSLGAGAGAITAKHVAGAISGGLLGVAHGTDSMHKDLMLQAIARKQQQEKK